MFVWCVEMWLRWRGASWTIVQSFRLL